MTARRREVVDSRQLLGIEVNPRVASAGVALWIGNLQRRCPTDGYVEAPKGSARVPQHRWHHRIP